MKKFYFLLFTFTISYSFGQNQNLLWVNQVGSTGSDYVYGIGSDASGNIYATGGFNGTVDFDPGPGTVNLTSFGTTDIYVAKYNSSGSLIWAKQFGGTLVDYGSSLGVDASGNVYVTGYFQGTADFDPDAGTFNLTSLGQYDIYNFKLNSSGNLSWAVSYGGTGFDFGRKIAVDAAGNSYTTGSFRSTVDFDPGPGVTSVVSLGLEDIYIEKLDPNGNLLWNRRVGGTGSDGSAGIELDGAGSLYITGGFSGTADMDPGGATSNLVSNGGTDGFVLRLDIASNFIWARGFGGSGTDFSNSIAIDPSGNVISGGIFVGTVDFDPGAGISNLTSSNPSSEGYILKLNSSGLYSWVKNISCDNNSQIKDLSVNGSSNIYITGRYIGNADLDPGPGNVNVTATPGGNVFNLIIDPLGDYLSSYGFGDISAPDEGYCIKALPNGNFISGGFFNGITDFEQGSGTVNLNSVGGDDGFVQKVCLSTSSSISPGVCFSYTSPSGNYTWNSTGVYTDTLMNNNGCDSIITINLTINSSTSIINPLACNSYNSPSGNYTWNTNGTYYDTIPNHVGCDSMITINLTLLPTTSNVNINACRSYTSPSTNYVWTTNGTYTDTLLNVIGCDSIITINLSLTNIDTNVTLSNGIFSVGQSGASYQWFDCIAAGPILGETNQSFTPTTNGSYGVLIDFNGCLDTTGCHLIANVGMEDLTMSNFSVYPNPADDIIQISGSQTIQHWQITDMTGKIILEKINESSIYEMIEISQLRSGNYILKVVSEKNTIHKMFIKK